MVIAAVVKSLKKGHRRLSLETALSKTSAVCNLRINKWKPHMTNINIGQQDEFGQYWKINF